jgi:hypothetical protein
VTVLHRPRGELRARVQTQLPEHTLHVNARRPFADNHLLGDVPIAQAARRQQHRFVFAPCQPVVPRRFFQRNPDSQPFDYGALD